MDVSTDVLHFNEGALAYAGYHFHDKPHPLHSHSFVEIAFVMAGAGTHVSRRGRETLQVGDVVLLRPGVWHGYDECQHLTLYNLCFSNELLRRELTWTRDDPMLGYLLWTGPYSAQRRGMLTTHLERNVMGQCEHHLEAISQLRRSSAAQYRADIVGRLSLLFGQVGRAVALAHELAPGGAAQIHPAIGQAMRLFEAELAHRWTLTELAAHLHLDPSYLVRLFKTSTGLPPMAYLAQLRAEHAATLLLHSDQPITSISQAVGWPDQNYFARRFKAHYGLSATTYRARFAAGADPLRFHRPSGTKPAGRRKGPSPPVSGAGIVPGQGTQD
jgi:AraC family L-rhamnose operon transcriptional activator RhaR